MSNDPAKFIIPEVRIKKSLSNDSQAFFTNISPSQEFKIKESKKGIRTIVHQAFQEVLDKMRLSVETANRPKPEGLLIIGDSDSGKSTLLRYFRGLLEKELIMHYKQGVNFPEGEEQPLEQNAVKPAFLFSIPSRATVIGVLERALSDNGVPLDRRLTLSQLEDTFYERLRELRTRVILIDEFHDIGGIGYKEQNLILKVLKEMTNNLSIPIIAAGTRAALPILQSDEQIWTRLEAIHLKRFDIDRYFRDFLIAYEQEAGFNLKNRMALNDKKFIGYLHGRTNGLAGQVTQLLGKAYELAIREGIDEITQELLEQVKFTPLVTAMSNPSRPGFDTFVKF